MWGTNSDSLPGVCLIITSRFVVNPSKVIKTSLQAELGPYTLTGLDAPRVSMNLKDDVTVNGDFCLAL